MMKKQAFSIGADPEVFIVNKSGHVVSMCGLVGGKKGDPLKIAGQVGILEDNILVEINFSPVTSAKAFADRATHAKTILEVWLHEQKGMSDWSVSNKVEALVPQKILQHATAKEFGCDPDFDAYSMGSPNPKVDTKDLVVKTREWRFAGGHIHIGHTAAVPPFVAANFCDLFLGLKFLGADPQKIRRQYYGQAGRYRPTPYGLEYRTLSNFWMFDHDTAMCVAQSVHNMVNFMSGNTTKVQSVYQQIPWGAVKTAINTADYAAASKLESYVSDELGVSL